MTDHDGFDDLNVVAFRESISYALDLPDLEGMRFLRLWYQAEYELLTKLFPDFDLSTTGHTFDELSVIKEAYTAKYCGALEKEIAGRLGWKIEVTGSCALTVVNAERSISYVSHDYISALFRIYREVSGVHWTEYLNSTGIRLK